MKSKIVKYIKRFIIGSLIVFFLGLGIIITVFLIEWLCYPHINIKVNKLYYQNPEVFCLCDEYYRNYNGNIYNIETDESIYSTTNKNFIAKEFDKLLWIYDNNSADNLKAIDYNGEIVKSYSLPKHFTDFIISNNAIMGVSPNRIDIYKLSDDGNAEQIQFEYEYMGDSEALDCKIYWYKSEYGTCLKLDVNDRNDDDFFNAIDSENENIIGSNMEFFHFDDEKMILAPDYNCQTFVSYIFDSRTEHIYHTDMNMESFPNKKFYSDSEKNISVGQVNTVRTAGRHPPVHISDEMQFHENDVLLCYDKKWFRQEYKIYTKTFERVLYTDGEKVITYYDEDFITYQIDSIHGKLEKLDSKKAEGIETGCSYTVEQCKDYIFVFDDESGEMVNKIYIKD